MMFGVAMSTERLHDPLGAFAHWAGATNAHIVAVNNDEGLTTRCENGQEN
jgi:hypothetical protein